MIEVSKLVRQLRGLVNLRGGTSTSDLVDGRSNDETPRVNTTKVGRTEVRETIKRDLPTENMKILQLDSHYWVPSRRGFNDVLNYHKQRAGSNIYQGDAYDCENYAISFAHLCRNRTGMNSIGFVYDGSAGHAYNIVVYLTTDGLIATLVEPNFWSMDGGEVEPTDQSGDYSVIDSTVFI